MIRLALAALLLASCSAPRPATQPPTFVPSAVASPTPELPTPIPTETRLAGDGAAPDRNPSGAISTALVGGIASWMPERYGSRYLALPEGRGLPVRICAARCLELTSTDAGPDRAMQRAGRVADIGVIAWEHICGLPRSRGLCEVTVEYR